MMAAQAGRKLRVKRNGVILAGVRTKTVTLNGEPIEITNDDDLGWRALLLDDVAVQGVDIAVEGVAKDDTLRQAYFNGEFIDDMDLEYDDGGVITGSFHMGSYAETGATEDALTFSTTFMSTGIVTYVPAAT